MAINRSNIQKQLIPGLNMVFGQSYGEVANEHAALYETENSNRSFEEEVLMTGFGTAPTKAEGDSITYDDAQENYTARYIHDTIALGFSITEEALEDNLYDTFSKVRAKALGRSMANTKQVKAANLFNLGFSTDYPIGDGAAFFSASHPTVGDGNQDNLGTGDLSETTLEQATIDISLFKDDRGILIGAMPKSLHIPSALQFDAFQFLKSDLSTTLGGASVTNVNDINALRAGGYFPGGVHVNHRFTDTDAWFVRTTAPNGTKHFVRVALQTATEGDFDTGNGKYKARERYSFGVSDWRQWYGSAGS